MINPVKEFFLFCSGASRKILGMNGCEVEHGKYVGIGATIFFTATLAALSGGYAMFTVFREENLAIAFGILWGLIIFNLDRFIVSSIKKQRMVANMPLTKRLKTRGSEVLKVVPRLILAVFISVVITKPLELKLFESELMGQITKDLILERTELENQIRTEYANIPILEADVAMLRKRLSDLETARNKRLEELAGEDDGFSGTRRPGKGPIYREKEAKLRTAEAELKNHQQELLPAIEAKERDINQRKTQRDSKIANAKNEIDNSPGLLKKLAALNSLTNNRSMFWASIFIVFLFISLETAPILVKLFSSRGPYDDYLDAIEHDVYANQRKKISDTNDDINTQVALSRQRNADRIKAEMQMSQNTMASWTTLAPQEYLDAQVEIAKIGIALWKANELNRLKQVMNAASYVGSSTIPLTQGATFVSQSAPVSSSAQNNNSGASSHTGTSTQPAPTQATTQAGSQASQTSGNPPAVTNMPPP